MVKKKKMKKQQQLKKHLQGISLNLEEGSLNLLQFRASEMFLSLVSLDARSCQILQDVRREYAGAQKKSSCPYTSLY